jgi:hypothetical protein
VQPRVVAAAAAAAEEEEEEERVWQQLAASLRYPENQSWSS